MSDKINAFLGKIEHWILINVLRHESKRVFEVETSLRESRGYNNYLHLQIDSVASELVALYSEYDTSIEHLPLNIDTYQRICVIFDSPDWMDLPFPLMAVSRGDIRLADLGNNRSALVLRLIHEHKLIIEGL
jgi:hypothetical protein